MSTPKRLLYGVQATGNGHLARARALAPELLRAGLEVDFVFSGRPRAELFNMEVFGADYRCFRGLTFVTEQGRLRLGKTLTHNKPLEFLRDVRQLDLSSYDLVLSDFEPVSAWAARLQGKTSMSISHQSAFVHPVPKVAGNLVARLLMRTFAPTQHKIGLHWHHFNQPVLPPLIEPQTPTPVNANKILVYMGFEELDDLIQLLKPFSTYEFVIYAKVDAPRQEGNLRIEPLSHEGFHRDLQDCNGIISNAGFELASEGIALGKKLLVKPLQGQYEQLCNAKALKVLQRGRVMQRLNARTVAQWLEQPAPDPVVYPNLAPLLAQWIKAGDYQDFSSLLQVWQDVDTQLLPNGYQLKTANYKNDWLRSAN